MYMVFIDKNMMLHQPLQPQIHYGEHGNYGCSRAPTVVQFNNGINTLATSQNGINGYYQAAGATSTYFIQPATPLRLAYFPRQDYIHVVPAGPPAHSLVFVPKILVSTTKSDVQQQPQQLQMSAHSNNLSTRSTTARKNGSSLGISSKICLSSEFYARQGVSSRDDSMANMTVVWNWNLEDEIEKITRLVKNDKYHYIGFDTEFPGFIYTERDDRFHRNHERPYQIFKANVDSMKVIQLGFTLFDESGKLCSDNHTWQFNFNFNVKSDRYSPSSINFLDQHGVDFEKHRKWGIDWKVFSKVFIGAGLVSLESARYITFHGIYDFGYLMKLLLGSNLPPTEREFLTKLKILFPYIYDLKHLVQWLIQDFGGGLQKLAKILNVKRLGRKHNGGSDAYVTGLCFFELRKLMSELGLTVSDFHLNGRLWGLSLRYSDLGYDALGYETSRKQKNACSELLNLKCEQSGSCPPGFQPLCACRCNRSHYTYSQINAQCALLASLEKSNFISRLLYSTPVQGDPRFLSEEELQMFNNVVLNERFSLDQLLRNSRMSSRYLAFILQLYPKQSDYCTCSLKEATQMEHIFTGIRAALLHA